MLGYVIILRYRQVILGRRLVYCKTFFSTEQLFNGLLTYSFIVSITFTSNKKHTLFWNYKGFMNCYFLTGLNYPSKTYIKINIISIKK